MIAHGTGFGDTQCKKERRRVTKFLSIHFAG